MTCVIQMISSYLFFSIEGKIRSITTLSFCSPFCLSYCHVKMNFLNNMICTVASLYLNWYLNLRTGCHQLRKKCSMHENVLPYHCYMKNMSQTSSDLIWKPNLPFRKLWKKPLPIEIVKLHWKIKNSNVVPYFTQHIQKSQFIKTEAECVCVGNKVLCSFKKNTHFVLSTKNWVLLASGSAWSTNLGFLDFYASWLSSLRLFKVDGFNRLNTKIYSTKSITN